MTEDFIVSADGHYVEPTDLFIDASAEAPARARGVGRGLRGRGARRRGVPLLPEAAHAGLRGLDLHAVPPPRRHRRRPAIPARIVEDLDHEGIRATLLHPNHALFGLYTHDHHELSMAHARVYSDYVAEAFAPYRDRVFTTSPIPLSDLDDAVAEIERVAALGARAIILPAISPVPYTSRALDPRVGGRAGERHARRVPRRDRRREGEPGGGADAPGHDRDRAHAEPRRAERRADRRSVDGARRDGAHGSAADRRVARRQRRARAVPGPALRARGVQRALARLDDGRDGQGVDAGRRAVPRLVGRHLGRRPPGRRPTRHGAAVPAQRALAVPADAERVRATPDPRVVPGRPRRDRVPARSPACRRSCGAPTTRTRKERSCTPARRSTTSSAESNPRTAKRSSAARSADCSASRLRPAA